MRRCTIYLFQHIRLVPPGRLIFIPASLLLLKHCSRSSLRSLVGDSHTETQPRLEQRSSASPRYFKQTQETTRVICNCHICISMTDAHCCSLQHGYLGETEFYTVLSVNVIDFMQNSNVRDCVFHGQDVQIF